MLIPLSLIAQLHPPDRVSAQPQGVDPYQPIEGDRVNLGPKGMYASLGFEDLDAIMPWIELRGGGGNIADARRSGLGF